MSNLPKYRAWHISREFISEVSAIHFDTEQVALVDSKNGAKQHLWDSGAVFLLLPTGLKDSKGVEIYESDMLAVLDEDGNKTGREHSVFFSGGSFILSNGMTIWSEKVEVIGNQHEINSKQS